MTITHTFVSSKSDGADNTVVQPSDWNAAHTIAEGYTLMRTKTVTLTNAQIKALPSTPVEIIAAPGEGKSIIPLFCQAQLLGVASNPYDDNFDDYAYMSLVTSPPSPQDVMFLAVDDIDLFLIGFTSFFRGSWDDIFIGSSAPHIPAASAGWGLLASTKRTSLFENKGLSISIANNATDLTGGDAANSIKVTVIYHVIDL